MPLPRCGDITKLLTIQFARRRRQRRQHHASRGHCRPNIRRGCNGPVIRFYRQNQTYVELFDQAGHGARRYIIALRDAANGWRLPKREMVAFFEGMSLVYGKVRPLFERPLYILTAPIDAAASTTVVRATGTVNPTYTVDISSQLSGRMAEVFVGFNDVVKAGQPLGRLDPEIFAAKVNEARAALKIAQAGVQVQQAMLERAKTALTTAQLTRNVTEANRIGLKAKFDENKRELERQLTLFALNIVSKADLSRTQAQRDARCCGNRRDRRRGENKVRGHRHRRSRSSHG